MIGPKIDFQLAGDLEIPEPLAPATSDMDADSERARLVLKASSFEQRALLTEACNSNTQACLRTQSATHAPG